MKEQTTTPQETGISSVKAAKPTLKKRKAAMLRLLEDNLGNVSTSCKALRMARSTHYKWYESDELYKSKVDEIQDVSLDFVESALFDRIREGDIAAIIFYLKTRGKKRGYTERIDHDVSIERMKLTDSELELKYRKAIKVLGFES